MQQNAKTATASKVNSMDGEKPSPDPVPQPSDPMRVPGGVEEVPIPRQGFEHGDEHVPDEA